MTDNPQTTSIHEWQWYDGMKHKQCKKCGECRPASWPDEGCKCNYGLGVKTEQPFKDAAEDKIMEVLGPLALTKGEVSIYDVAMAFFKYGAEWERQRDV